MLKFRDNCQNSEKILLDQWHAMQAQCDDIKINVKLEEETNTVFITTPDIHFSPPDHSAKKTTKKSPKTPKTKAPKKVKIKKEVKEKIKIVRQNKNVKGTQCEICGQFIYTYLLESHQNLHAGNGWFSFCFFF